MIFENLEIFIFFFFFLKDDDDGPSFFLKMNEAWSNAPSLRYEFMVLKNLNLINFYLFSFFESSDASHDFFFFFFLKANE